MAKQIHVLFINHTAKLGGGEIALNLLLRHLSEAEVKHSLVLFEEGPLVAILPSATAVHVLPMSDSMRNARKDSLGSMNIGQLGQLFRLPGYVLRLRRLIRKLDVDLIHTNSLKADIIGGLAARLAGKPVIWHVRDRIAPDYLPAKVVGVFRKLARIIPTAIIANSQATLDTLELDCIEQGGKRRQLAAVVHDGFDFTSLADPKPRSTAYLSVGLIGRLSPWKGQDVFLRAIGLISSAFPNVRFFIIGSALFGERTYEEQIHTLRTDLGLEAAVEFCGFVTDIQERIADLDLVVHASTISEPFGQVVIESMAEGKAVIATRGGGVSEIIEDNVSGVLVPPKDHVALADAMAALLRDPERRTFLGMQGRRRVETSFRIESTAAKVLAFYTDVLRRPDTRRM